MRTLTGWALAPLAVLSLAACGGDGEKAGVETAAGATSPSSRTLAATLKGDDSFGTLGQVVTGAGLTAVLDGKGPYTVFAPADAAFGTAGTDFTSETMQAQSAALLRAHIVPGALTRADILSAVTKAGAVKGVEMRTMGDTMLTFSRDGDALVVTSADGARARLTGQESLASNGVLQPVDALLVKPVAPTPSA